MLPFSNLIWKTANTTPIYFSQTKVSLFILGFQRYLQISFFIKIARFLDDGLGIEYEFLKACNNSKFVCYTLTVARVIPNSSKSFWTPRQKITFFSIDIDITNNIKITSDRIVFLIPSNFWLSKSLYQPENYPYFPVKLFLKNS